MADIERAREMVEVSINLAERCGKAMEGDQMVAFGGEEWRRRAIAINATRIATLRSIRRALTDERDE